MSHSPLHLRPARLFSPCVRSLNARWTSRRPAYLYRESQIAYLFRHSNIAEVRFHPEDVDIAVHQYGSAVREGRDIRLQYRVRRSDGDFRWMIARGTCIRDPETSKVTGFVCTLTDGQELINARQEAIQAKQYMSTILKASAIALVGVDMSGTIEIFEGTVPALMSEGIASENVVGRNFDEVWPHRECADQVMRLIKTAREVSTAAARPDAPASRSIWLTEIV